MKRHFLLILFYLIAILVSLSISDPVCNNAYRVDCGLDSQSQCESSGCCWQPYERFKEHLDHDSSRGYPFCFHSWQQALGYNVSWINETDNGFVAQLSLEDGTHIYGDDINLLQLQVFVETENRLHIKITDPNNPDRWQVPGVVQSSTPIVKPDSTDYAFSYTSYPFGFAVTRVSTQEVLFNSTPTETFNGLVFEDQYLELSTSLPSIHNLFGLGERIGTMRLFPSTYTLWNADQGAATNTNIYGSHPFYMDVRSDGTAYGVFMLSSNGMDVILQESSLTYKIIGGVIDMYFFMGPTPEEVVKQYEAVIGTPYFPPYWSLGFHQCRWGYHNLSEVEHVVHEYAANNIPLETMWTDIDYMDAYHDFTFDPVRYPPAQVNEFVNNLHANHQQYIVITDPGVPPGYFAYYNGTDLDIWVKNSTGQYFIGFVWPGLTVFPDWWNPQTFGYWHDMIDYFHGVVPIDGLWIDMNEISNFCNGQCGPTSNRPSITETGAFNPNNPPYKINNRGNAQQPLDYKTMSADAVHSVSIEYNTHNMFGMMETWATSKALESVRGERAVVVSRSTFPGSGHHGSHWTGDVSSEFYDLSMSIPDMLNFQMYGIPFVGADICGFNGASNEQLCGRWIEVGAFYPFCRNHNAIGNPSQELYVWPSVANISRNVLAIRYSLLPFYYTLFYRANTYGGTVVRPLFYEFPSDSNTWTVEFQFLIGSGIMVSPVVTENAVTVDAYFPAANWYDFYTYEKLSSSGTAENLTLDAPFEFIPLHILGGTIIPTQEPSYSTWESRQNPFTLLVPLDANGSASGDLYLDDGVMINPVEVGAYSYMQFVCSYSNGAGSFTSKPITTNYVPTENAVIESVVFLGVDQGTVQTVSVNGKQYPFEYNSDIGTLTVTQLNQNVLQTLSIQFES